MTATGAKEYLSKREIPQLFESLMTGLMYYRPEDHITYLQDCLRKIKDGGIEQVKWNIFIESRKRVPLPPITPESGTRPISRNRSFITEGPSKDNIRGEPLPPIRGDFDANFPDRIALPKCPIVLVMGGPGCGRGTQCKMLLQRYYGWVHLSIGDLLKNAILEKGSTDAKWGAVSQLVSQGDLAPDEQTIDVVIAAIGKNMEAKGIIIEGFPRTLDQVANFEKIIGRCDLCFMLDCEEHLLQQRLLKRGHSSGRVDDNLNAVASRINFFKSQTLPAIKHFDDKGKVVIVDGDRDTYEVFYDIVTLLDSVFYPQGGAPLSGVIPEVPGAGATDRPGSTSYVHARTVRPGSPYSHVPLNISIAVPDTGRKDNMPKCPIILVMGGPGSGRNAQCKQIAATHTGFVHISMGDEIRHEIVKKQSAENKWKMIGSLVQDGNMAPEDITIDIVKDKLIGSRDAKAIILEGYPRTKEQVEELNRHVGGISLVILIDCEEFTLQKNLTDRASTANRVDDSLKAIGRRISFFKHNALPILGHYDDYGKLEVVNGDRDEADVNADVNKVIDHFIAIQSRVSGVILPILPQYSDHGRKTGFSGSPIIGLVGSPGCDLEKHGQSLAEKYTYKYIDLTEKDTSDLMSALKAGQGSAGFVLGNYPINKQQVDEFNAQIGGMTHIIVLDTDEAQALKQTSDIGIVQRYKENTLPVLGYYDDFRKLDLVDVERSNDILGDMCAIMEKALAAPKRVAPNAVTTNFVSVARLGIAMPDTGRQDGLPSCKIVSVMGAPGCGFENQVTAAVEKDSNMIIFDATSTASFEAILTVVKDAGDDATIVLQGAPKSQAQVESFNTMIGGMTGVIVVDTSEQFCTIAGASADDIAVYKEDTLPVLAHYDDLGKLMLVKGEKEATVVDNLCNILRQLSQG